MSKKKLKKIIYGIGALAGVLAVILAFVCFGKYEGYTESSKSYGGDAYTGIQNASAQAANNTYHLAEITKFAGGSILLVIGLISIAGFGAKIVDDLEDDKTVNFGAPLFRGLSQSQSQTVFGQQKPNNTEVEAASSSNAQTIREESTETKSDDSPV